MKSTIQYSNRVAALAVTLYVRGMMSMDRTHEFLKSVLKVPKPNITAKPTPKAMGWSSLLRLAVTLAERRIELA